MTSTAAQFHSDFQAAKEHIQALVSAITGSATEASTKLSGLRSEYQAIAASLPKYDQGRYEQESYRCHLYGAALIPWQQLRELEKAIAAARARSQPAKAKFAFGKAGSAPRPREAPSVTTTVASIHLLPFATTAARTGGASEENAYVITDKQSELVRLPSVGSSSPAASTQVRAISLSSLKECLIDLTSGRADPTESAQTIGALHLSQLERCILLAPIASGSVLLHGVKDSLLILGGRQFRMHSSVNTRVFLHSVSEPILEHCTDVAIGAYPSELALHTSLSSLHEKIQDFDWVKGGSSPNWSLLSQSAFPTSLLDAIRQAPEDDVTAVLKQYLPMPNA